MHSRANSIEVNSPSVLSLDRLDCFVITAPTAARKPHMGKHTRRNEARALEAEYSRPSTGGNGDVMIF